jgi:enterochelin esterase-like enzyme
MGGSQSLTIGLRHLDQFAWIGGFSAPLRGGSVSNLVRDAQDTAKQLKLLWVSCGDTDRLMDGNESLHAVLGGRPRISPECPVVVAGVAFV